jgi:DNA-binding PadR family transcriptional regulator
MGRDEARSTVQAPDVAPCANYVRDGYIRHGHPHPPAMRTKDTRPSDFLPLTPAVLHILLAVADGEQHGYAIARAVEELTEGTVRMGPGTLYGSIGRMVESGLLEESSRPRGRAADDERRRFYRLTPLGRRVLESETDRLARVVALARAKNVLRRPEPA